MTRESKPKRIVADIELYPNWKNGIYIDEDNPNCECNGTVPPGGFDIDALGGERLGQSVLDFGPLKGVKEHLAHAGYTHIRIAGKLSRLVQKRREPK